MRFFLALSLLAVLLSGPAWCQQDLMTERILARKPATPSEFLTALKETGRTVNTHMVANRGALNPAQGSFSVFGDIGPQLTFGIFVEPDENGHLTLQESFSVRLLIEVITTDRETGLHNFWELIGDGEGSGWHYRGNSLDVIADASEINMGPNDKPLFGARLRCSGCHTGGGLVMKERFPYNDWLNDEPLDAGKWKSSPWVERTAANSLSASHLDGLVKESLESYVRALEKRSPERAKQWVRSVLAPLEMNLVSDLAPYRSRLETGSQVELPAAFFVDPRLSGPQEPVKVPVGIYAKALEELGSSFASDETPGLVETQYAFVVPTVSRFDMLRTQSLIERGLLDEELLADLLAIDFTTPLYSPRRLALMSLFSDNWSSVEELRSHLDRVLESRGTGDDDTALFADHYRDDRYNLAYHRREAAEFLDRCRARACDLETVKDWIRLAAQRRQEIQTAQTSANPRGSILEGGLGPGGFRRIFASYRDVSPVPHKFYLDPESCRLKSR